jgi:cell division protein FtsQ
LQAEQPSVIEHRTRFRHAGGPQTGALKRPLLSALIAGGIIMGVIATVPHWAGWMAEAETDFITFSADNGYIVRDLQVTGRDRIPAKDLLAALNIQRGQPLFAYHPQNAQDAVQQLPGIKSVFIERRWPDTVFVRLQERQPAARWQQHEQITIVDTDGKEVSVKSGEDVTAYPIIIGNGATQQIVPLFQLLKAEPTLLSQIKAATWMGQRRWDLTLRNGLVIKLPANNTGLALRRLMALAKKQQLFERDLAVIDIRLPQQAVLRPTKRADLLIERPDFSDPGTPGKKNI